MKIRKQEKVQEVENLEKVQEKLEEAKKENRAIRHTIRYLERKNKDEDLWMLRSEHFLLR